MIKYLLICGSDDVVHTAVRSSVDRVFIDLEINGKIERQGHLNTHITTNSISDVAKARSIIDGYPAVATKLLVRVNPYFHGSAIEIEEVILSGADYIMLPMIKSTHEVEEVVRIINGRAKFIPLIETVYSFNELERICNTKGVDEIYFGLNDLHLDAGLTFMFEPISNGMLDRACNLLVDLGMPFGFGGIARVGEGLLPGESVLGEHLRLQSSAVILSRTFMSSCPDNTSTESFIKDELNKLRYFEKIFLQRDEASINSDHVKACEIINEIIRKKNEKSV